MQHLSLPSFSPDDYYLDEALITHPLCDSRCTFEALTLSMLLQHTGRRLSITSDDKLDIPGSIAVIEGIETKYGLSDHSMSMLFHSVMEQTNPVYLENLCSLGCFLPLVEMVKYPSRFFGKINRLYCGDLYKLEAGLLQCKDGMTILDPFAGYGYFFSSLNGISPQLYLQEWDYRIAGTLAALSIIFDYNIGQIRCGDSTKGVFPDVPEFDRMIMEQIHVDGTIDNQNDHPTQDFDPVYAPTIAMYPFSLAAKRLKEKGIAVIRCNLSVLYGTTNNKQHARAALLKENLIDAVIELPSDIVMDCPITNALVVIKKGRREKTVHMIDARRPSMWTPLELYQNPDIFPDPERSVHALVSIDELLENGANLCASPYLKSDSQMIISDDEFTDLLKSHAAREKRIIDYSQQIQQLIKKLQ